LLACLMEIRELIMIGLEVKQVLGASQAEQTFNMQTLMIYSSRLLVDMMLEIYLLRHSVKT
jgi:hypothetical protein